MSDVTEFVGAECRICGEPMKVPMVAPLVERRKEAKTMLAEHVTGHTWDQVVRVYVLGEPWWKVVA